ncbi:MAG: NUDIX domain-containing protein [Pseudomonadota bacterium]
MTKENANPIPAATILLLRDAPALEVLMIERHPDTPFAGGALVFPGGRIDPGDRSDDWRDHCDGVEDIPADELAPRIAAIRESFEEAGILLARRDGKMLGAEVHEFDHLRKAIEQDETIFLKLVRDESLRLALDVLRLFARWEPPAGVTHRRYHTWFFAARTPHGQEAREDGDEATETLWTSPEGALQAAAEGERKMIYPTVRNVELLSIADNADAVIDFAKRRKIETIVPYPEVRDGVQMLCIPDDLGYPVTAESIETAFRS